VKCEKWIRDDDDRLEESKTTSKTAAWLLNRLIGQKEEVNFGWPFPFVEGQLFVLTLSAGLEGYHVSVDGRHVTSFPYRTVSAYVSPLHAVRNVGEFLLIAVHYLLQLAQIISGWGQLRLSVLVQLIYVSCGPCRGLCWRTPQACH
jgi:hypothetical protein